MFLAVSSAHCSWNDWSSVEMFHNFLFIVRTGLKLAGLKCGVRKTKSLIFWRRFEKACGLNHDHENGSSRARSLHCTTEWLTLAMSPNVGNSTSSFLLVGICVRAKPFNLTVQDWDLTDRKALPNLSCPIAISTSERPGRWHHPLNEGQFCSSATLCLGAKSSELWYSTFETSFLWSLPFFSFS